MGHRFWKLFLVFFFFSTFLVVPADAFISTVTPAGTPVRWKSGFKFDLAGNPGNQSGITSEQFFSAVVHSLQRWQQASGGSVKFDYWQGTDPNIYEPDSDYNGLSSIYFASNAKKGAPLSPNVLGMTQVWYNSDSGEILESDTILNDKYYTFTTNPEDTTGFGGIGGTGVVSGVISESFRPKVFIENVITHELGHALGLSHSADLQSTMLFVESPEQAHLSCDEQIGIHALYPNGDAKSRGSINGTVISDSGAPIFGAHILAISRRRGAVLATALSDKSGHYEISALEPGSYFIMAEPYFAGSSVLSSYYSSIQLSVCGGFPFRRSVLGDAKAYPVVVNSGFNVAAPPIKVQCDREAPSALSSASSGTPVIYSGEQTSQDRTGFGVVDRFGSVGSSLHYRLNAISGSIEIHALSYSLYSPVHAALSLSDSTGNTVPSQVLDRVYTGDSGYVNYDSALIAEHLPHGDYYLEVNPSGLSPTQYPAGPISLDATPFLVLTGSVNEPLPAMQSEIPFNARCRMDEVFPNYNSPPGDPPRHSLNSDTVPTGCATVQNRTDKNNDGGAGSTGAILGWFLPFLAFGLIVRGFKLASENQSG